MRDIKFRCWYAGHLYYGIPSIEFRDGLSRINLNHDPMDFSQTPDTWADCGEDFKLMQFTGILDKNGNEIYEGDILWTYEHGVGNLVREVVFDGGSFCVKHKSIITTELRGWKPDYLELKGNIYQNPELLKTIRRLSV